MDLRARVRNWRNPDNLTALHLRRLSERYGHEIGAHSYGCPKVRFAESGSKLTIGRFCSIADRVEIMLGGNHRADWASTYPFAAFRQSWPRPDRSASSHEATRGDVVIGSDVWIGSGALIMSGVTIGHGAIIGARSVVSRNVSPYSVAAGNPARLVRQRFPDPLVAGLLETAWWELSDEDVAALMPLLASERVSDLIDAARVLRRRGRRAGTG